MIEPSALYAGNADFLDALYEQYLRDPASVEPKWREYFASIAPPVAGGDRAHSPNRAEIAERARQPRAAAGTAPESGHAAKQAAVSRLIQIWVNRAHLIAKLDPLGLQKPQRPRVLDIAYFGLSNQDLDTEFVT